MKRDPELIREILIEIEDCPADRQIRFCAEGGDDVAKIKHVELLIEAGYVKGHVQHYVSNTSPEAYVSGLTWEGHDFVSAVRDNSIWQKTKEHVLKPAASWTFAMIVEYAKAEAKKRLGI